jgi:hypothetical protein
LPGSRSQPSASAMTIAQTSCTDAVAAATRHPNASEAARSLRSDGDSFATRRPVLRTSGRPTEGNPARVVPRFGHIDRGVSDRSIQCLVVPGLGRVVPVLVGVRERRAAQPLAEYPGDRPGGRVRLPS